MTRYVATRRMPDSVDVTPEATWRQRAERWTEAGERAIPGARWLRTSLRTLHLIAVGALYGGHVYGVDVSRLWPALLAVLLTGGLLIGFEVWQHRIWLVQVRGVVTFLKLGLVATVVLGENRITALVDTRDAAMTPRQAMWRGFLRNIVAPIADAAQELSTRQHEHIAAGELLSGIPERQKHVLEHRGRLPASSPSWLLSKTSGCDDCCRCVGVCPTGALSRQRKDGQRIFGVATERCTGCHACLDFCSKGGLALSRATADCEVGTAVHHEGSSTGDDLFCTDSETASKSSPFCRSSNQHNNF